MSRDTKRRDALINGMHNKYGADGLVFVLASAEAIVALKGEAHETQMSAFLSDVARSMPWMMEPAETFASAYAAHMTRAA